MALNRSMHPRNRYKDKPPDFAYLASKYPEFRQHVHTNLTGRVGKCNMSNSPKGRSLVCTLRMTVAPYLHVMIYMQKLRSTYTAERDSFPFELSEETRATDENPHEHREQIQTPRRQQDSTPGLELNPGPQCYGADLASVRAGADVPVSAGTGASCIYPLLGATMNGWYFLATEVDDICYNYAKKNVEQNNLSDLIKVVKVPQKTLLMDALKEETAIVYDFCMCNPPFFANQLEAKGVNSRNARRPPPSSVNTGGVTEIMAEGGELEFVKRIIHDSLQLKRRLRWYSCMLGKKCSLAPLKEELKKQGVPKVTHTEFCQGRTMRWALAWSFCDDVTVPSPPSKKRKLEKARKPITFTVLGPTVRELAAKASSLGSPARGSTDTVTAWIEKTLADLRVLHKRVPCGKSELSLFLTAVENSWIHLRQKRRDRGRQLRELPRAPLEGVGGTAQTPVNPQPTAQSTNSQANPETVQHFLFKCLMNVKEEGGDVTVEMHWVEGQNRDLMNQLCTYLKNQLFRLVANPV
ncbi:MET16 methyltransferase, partial [Atractosteus spatula]|nr:MET16 methyltransferase [Atractosteus spatula]